jgi:hypothetical protein
MLCALEVLSEAQGAQDAAALRVSPWHCSQRAWVESNPADRHRADNPPIWASDGRAWTDAVEAVGQRWDSYQQPWAIVLDVYRATGGRVQ